MQVVFLDTVQVYHNMLNIYGFAHLANIKFAKLLLANQQNVLNG